jgi:hypothetical protein
MSTGRQTTNTNVFAGAGRVPGTRPALDPLSPLLVQPYKALVEQGIISEITVRFGPNGAMTEGKASSILARVEGSGLNETDSFPLGKLIAAARAAGLTGRKGDKKAGAKSAEQKPARSLCASDFELPVPALQERCNSIARACGGGPLVGRVRSAGRFDASSGTRSYQDWWQSAPPKDRALSLSEGKRLAAFTPEMIGRLAGVQCPFRGTLDFVVAEEEEEEEERGTGRICVKHRTDPFPLYVGTYMRRTRFVSCVR